MGEKNGGRRLNKRKRFWLRAGIVVGALFVIYLLIGFFLAPRILHSQLEKQLKDLTGRSVTVESVKMNPLTLSATIDGFRMHPEGVDGAVAGNDQGEPDLMRFQTLYVDVSSSSIWRFA